MRRCVVRAVACAALLPLARPNAVCASAFTVDSWGLTVGVDNGWPDYAAATFLSVENPFVDQHAVTLPSNPIVRAAAQYDISWLMGYGSFDISAQQTAQASAAGMVFTVTCGDIYITTTEPMPLHIDASWTYILPVDYMTAFLGVAVYDPQSHENIFGQSHQAGTFPGEPSFGTLAIEGDAILTPGETWVLRYEITTHAYAGTQGHSATGDGHVDFTITPEPATLALLAPLLLAIRGHAKRPRRARPA